MPAFSFKERFVPMVKDGTKTQTVRANRKHNPRPGQFAHLFWGMRTKHCTRLIPAQTISEVRSIIIVESGAMYLYPMVLDKQSISIELATILNGDKTFMVDYDRFYKVTIDKDLFAWLDGFRPDGSTKEKPAGAFTMMFEYWKENNELPFTGTVTYWNK